MIEFSKITTGQEEIDAVTRVIESGWLAAGPETEAFEKEFAKYVGVKYAIFTNSGTSALKLAYKYYKEWFDKNKSEYMDELELSYPKNTFCATYSAGTEMGIRMSRENPDANFKIKSKLWDTRVTVHYGSVKDETPCFIEDSAHRIEPNDPLIGKIRCYSFYATKNMTTGSGGMFVTNDKEIYEEARLYWRDGLTTSTADRARGPVDYEVKAFSGGYDGNDIAAAIGRVQLKKLPQFTKRRGEIRDRYNSAFGQAWLGNHLYPYFVNSEEEVKSLRQFLFDNGIGSGYHYPGTGWLGVSLPIYPLLTDKEQDCIIEKIKEWQLNSTKKSK